MGVPHVDIDWAEDQLHRANLPESAVTTVLALLERWNTETEGHDLKETEQAAAAFKQLALGYSLTPDTPDEIWVPAALGFIVRGDTVRVKSNAHTGEAGKIHNGRVGRVVAVRSGDVIFKSTDDREPALDGTHYRPDALEKRIR